MFMSGLLSNANIREAKTPMILACQIECHRPLQKLITNPEDEKKKRFHKSRMKLGFQRYIYICFYLFIYLCRSKNVCIYVPKQTITVHIKRQIQKPLDKDFLELIGSFETLLYVRIHTHIDHQFGPDPNPSGMIRRGTKKQKKQVENQFGTPKKNWNLDPTQFKISCTLIQIGTNIDILLQ